MTNELNKAPPPHTPGPWRTCPNTPSLVQAVGRKGDDIIAQAFDPVPYIGIPEMWANARLIAAAPDLLRVLEAIWRLQHDGCTEAEWRLAWADAEAVMDTARGEA